MEYASVEFSGATASPDEFKCQAIVSRITQEHRHDATMRKLLAYCMAAKTFEAIVEASESYPEMRGTMFPISTILTWLVDVGALSMTEAQHPETSTTIDNQDDNEASFVFETTLEGAAALKTFDSEADLEDLILNDAVYGDIFADILLLCKVSQPRQAVEDFLRNVKLLENPKRYPGFFLTKLREAGGLEWDGGWHCTSEGMAVARRQKGGHDQERKSCECS